MKETKLRFIDLFCGIGGFRTALKNAASDNGILTECVFSSDIDPFANEAYKANYGEMPSGDICAIDAKDIPDHDVLLGGFPCQPFSIIGEGRGFDDTRGTLFFEIARILKAKRPKAFVLENVKRLVSHHNGRTFNKIMEALRELGYTTEYRVLNALDFGLPQKRERVFIVGLLGPMHFSWPSGTAGFKPLGEVLERDVPIRYYASDDIKNKRKSLHKSKFHPSIWHENKAGNVSSYPYSCALRAGASYNYLLVNGERRLTPREMLRLQGFPDSFNIVCNDSQTRRQAGNALPVPVAEAVIRALLPYLTTKKTFSLNEERKSYSSTKTKSSTGAKNCPKKSEKSRRA